MVKIAPSLLSADFMHMGADIQRMADAGADYLHFDVMDGQFVPNMSFAMPVLKAAAKGALPVDAHLMIVDPERYIDSFAACGASIITVHAEATNHLHRAIQQIHAAGCKAGVALNPATDLSCLKYVINDLDLLLIMTVNPGFGGQKLIPACIQKVAEAKRMLTEAQAHAVIEVDGGVNTQTAVPLVQAGAEILVAGSALFGAADAAAFIREIREKASAK